MTSSSEAVHGRTTEKTFCSRMRRAINCVYCAPKSRMTIDGTTEDGLSDDGLSDGWLSDEESGLDRVSTDECLRFREKV